jgi:hypothetical protein
MGRPVGSINRERPFNEALRIALHQRPYSLRRVADRLIDSRKATFNRFASLLITWMAGLCRPSTATRV